MRAFLRLPLLLLLAASLGGTAAAQDDPGPADALPPAAATDADPDPSSAAPSPPEPSRAETLDALFAKLKRKSSAEEAEGIAAEIQAEWLRSGSETVDLLMQWSAEAMVRKDSAAALDLVEQVLVLEPSYAEAWNRRATLNFTLSHFGRSIADIEQTLAREPRHFDALMGLGSMLEEMDRDAQALETYIRALAVYPALKGAQEAVARLSEKLAGQAI